MMHHGAMHEPRHCSASAYSLKQNTIQVNSVDG